MGVLGVLIVLSCSVSCSHVDWCSDVVSACSSGFVGNFLNNYAETKIRSRYGQDPAD